MGYEANTNIEAVQDDVLVRFVLRHLSPEDAARTGRVSRRFLKNSRDQELWRAKFAERFPLTYKTLSPETISNWYFKFQEVNKTVRSFGLSKEEREPYFFLKTILQLEDTSQEISLDNVIELLGGNSCKTLFFAVKELYLQNERNLLNKLYEIALKYYSEELLVNPQKVNTYGMTVLHWAVLCYQSPSTIRALILQGCDVNAICVDSVGFTPLHFAVDYIDGFRTLLELGANPNIRSLCGYTPLQFVPVPYVETSKRIEVIKILLEHQIDINSTTNVGETIFYLLVQRGGNIEEINFLLECGANINAACNDGWSPLHIAIQERPLEVIKLLLDRGADINATLPNGHGVLHIAATNGRSEVTAFLLDSGMDIHAVRNDGATPLYIAAAEGHLEVVSLLLNRGATIDSTHNDGTTVLHIAVKQGKPEVVKFLLNRGADINAVDNNGATVFALAKVKGCIESIKALLKQMVLNYLDGVLSPEKSAKKPNKKFSLFPSAEYSKSQRLAAGSALIQAISNPEDLVVLEPHKDVLNDKNELKSIYDEFRRLIEKPRAACLVM